MKIEIVVLASLGVAGSASGQTLMRTHEGPAIGGAFGTAVAALQDLDGDGVRDYAISDCGVDNSGKTIHAGTVDVFSGANGATLFTIQGGGSGTFGVSLSDAGDVDGDGIPDLLVGDPHFDDPSQSYWQEGAVRTYSGKDGALIREIFGAWTLCRLGNVVAGLDDVDADGVPDFLVSAQMDTSGSCHAFGVSGKSGTKLYEVDLYLWQGSGTSAMKVGVDRDGDGIRDVLVIGGDSIHIVRACSGATGATIFEYDLGAYHYQVEGIAVSETSDVDADGQPEMLVEYLDWSFVDNWVSYCDLLSIAKATVLRSERGHDAATLQDLDGDGIGEYLLTVPMPRDGAVRVMNSGRMGNRMAANLPDLSFKEMSVGDLDGDGVADFLASNANGSVEVFSNVDFWIGGSPNPAMQGYPETLVTGRVPTGNPIGIALIAVGGTPMFQFVFIAPADGTGGLSLSDTVPPGLSGLNATFQGFAIGNTGAVVASTGTTIDFN